VGTRFKIVTTLTGFACILSEYLTHSRITSLFSKRSPGKSFDSPNLIQAFHNLFMVKLE
jgi:hypothetical protein